MADPADAALRVLDAYMAAFNARDEAAFEATFNPPHVSIGVGAPAIAERGRATPAWEAVGAAASGWGHSTFDQTSVVHAGPDKVHLATRITRHRLGGGVIGTYDVLYVVTRENGHWGMKALSGLPAPAP